MKTTVLLLSLLPMAAFAKEPFEGHWKARMDSFRTTGAPDVYELKDGKTISFVDSDKLHNSTTSFIADRQK